MLREACWSAVVAVVAGGPALAQPENGSDQSSDSNVLTAPELFATPALMTDGLNVRFENAVVRAKSGIILRVSAAKHDIFVVPADPSSLDFLAVGARVNIQGTLRPTPTAPQARLVYAMSRREAQRLAHTRFYVDAWALSAAE